ncbi:variable surface lipoprotein [Mycoplasmopsis bovis]|nr:variable surface lipoprotein [Mycoplasmopsis bovis]QQH26849.1 variable surface lipoprotein [Mycoplasmopsis bovis]
MKKINKIFITLASIVSISSLPIVAASCDVEKTEEGTGANSDTKDQEDQTSFQKTKRNKLLKRTKATQTLPKDQKEQTPQKDRKGPKNQKDL